jgi:hypothetical protein
VEVTVSVVGSADGGDVVRALRSWLLGEDVLRGRVRLVTTPPAPGTLGSVLATVAIAVGPGGAATVFASALIAWIRRQRSDIRLKVSRPDGTSVEMSADHVRLGEDELRRLTGDLLRFVEGDGE